MKNYPTLTSIDRIADLGGAGSGKSNSASIIIRKVREKKQPVWIIDTSNDYGDLAKVPKMFKVYKANKFLPGLLPGKLKRTKQSALINFEDIKDVDSQRKWITAFLKGCFESKNKYPALIVIDEAHNFVGQKDSRNPTQRECKYWINKLLSEGRKYGLGSMIISQRSSKIDKDSLAECNRVLVHRHTLDLDIKRLNNYLKQFGIDSDVEVPRLKVGEVLDVDFEGFNYSKYQMPLDKSKKLGRTPKPRSVDPTPEKFTDKIKDMDIGLEREEVIIAVGVITLLSVLSIIIYLMYTFKGSSIIEITE